MTNIFRAVIALIFLVVSFVAVSIINSVKTDKSINNVDTAYDSYIGMSGSGTEYDPYLISSTANLNSLAAEINSGDISYAYQYYKLTCSLDFGGAYFDGIGVQGKSGSQYGANGGPVSYNTQYAFYGHFDGGGYTVSNFKIKVPEAVEMIPSGYFEGGLGFFACLTDGATVSNLKLSDFELQIQTKEVDISPNNRLLYVGGIAGGVYADTADGDVKISCCSVENMTISLVSGSVAQTYFPDAHIGGLVGASYGKGGYNDFLAISDCYLENLVVASSVDANFLDIGGDERIGAIIGSCSDSTSTSIYGSVKYSTDTGTAGPYATISNCVLAGDNTDRFEKYISGNYLNGKFDAGTTNVYLTKPTSYNLGQTGALSKTGSTWFMREDYNDNYPYLRQFIVWNTITIKKENSSSDISINLTSLLIPSDWGFPFTTSTEKTVNILGTNVTVKDKNDGVGTRRFIKWAYSYSSTLSEVNSTLTAYSTYKISFTESCINEDLTNMAFGTEYDISTEKNTAISISYNYYKAGTIKTITFSFKDVDNISRSVTYDSNETEYYIEGTNLGVAGVYYMVKADTLNICVQVMLKSYNTNFK